MKYDVFDMVDTCGPAFEIVSDEEAARLRDIGNTGDIGCDDGDEGVQIARAVTAAVACELVGLPLHQAERLESHIAEYGSLGIGNLTENFEVWRTRDD